MARVRIAWDNLFDYDEVTLTASSSDSSYPVANLRSPHRTVMWRSGTANGGVENVVLDLTLLGTTGFGVGGFGTGAFGGAVTQIASRKASCVFLINHNFGSGVNARIQGNATDSWASPALDVAIAYHKDMMAAFFTEAEHQFWRLYVDNSAAGNTVEVGRAHLGTYLEPKKDVLMGWSVGSIDPSRMEVVHGASERWGKRGVLSALQFSFRGLPASDKYTSAFLTMLGRTGSSRPVFVALDPDGQPNDLSFYGRITNLGSFACAPNETQQVGFGFQEAA